MNNTVILVDVRGRDYDIFERDNTGGYVVVVILIVIAIIYSFIKKKDK